MAKSKSGKSIILQVEVDDIHGKQKINFSSLRGWRMALVEKYLVGQSEEWSDDTARKFLIMKVLNCAKNEFEGAKFLGIVKGHGTLEVHFWSAKFMINDKAVRAWRVLYC